MAHESALKFPKAGAWQRRGQLRRELVSSWLQHARLGISDDHSSPNLDLEQQTAQSAEQALVSLTRGSFP